MTILFKNPLAFKIEIMLEKTTTNPPINKIVEMLFVILLPKTSPKLEKDTLELVLKFECDDK